jgi:O-antigen/teichoic acid export membrane protein
MTNLDVAGSYSANYKLGIFMMLFVSMFQFAWQPFFFQHAEEKNIKQVFSKILTYFTIVSCFLLVILSLFIDDLIKIPILHRTLIGPKYWSGVVIVPIVLFGYVFNGIYYILSAGMFIKEKSFYIPIITGAGAIINVGVNILLIPVWGIVGAALATLAAYLFMAVGVYFATQKFYKVQYENSKVLMTMFFVLVTGALYYYLFNTHNLLLIYRFLILAGYIISVLVFVMDKQELSFLKKKTGFTR